MTVLMEDHESAEYIMTLHEPRKQKAAGRNVQYWDQEKWDKNCYNIVRDGNVAKVKYSDND